MAFKKKKIVSSFCIMNSYSKSYISGISTRWVKTILEDYIDDEMGLIWLPCFYQQVGACHKGYHWRLVLYEHKSRIKMVFGKHCKTSMVVVLCKRKDSSYLPQWSYLDVFGRPDSYTGHMTLLL